MNEKKNISSIINQNIDYYKTPCYVIDKKQFLINLSEIQKNFQQEWGMNVLLGYSVKTNHFPVLLQIAKDENMMAEAVSDDEYFYALSQGYDKKSIIFNGPQKSEKYLINAIKSGSIVNIDNLEEIGIIEKNYK